MTILTDYNYGLKRECETLKILQEKFGSDLKKTVGQYNRFDFISSGCMIELKSRRCSVNTYPDTMVGLNKLEYAKKHTDKKVVFCFNFNEGLYYHIFNPEKEYSIRQGGRCDRGKAEYKSYFYINSADLLKVSS